MRAGDVGETQHLADRDGQRPDRVRGIDPSSGGRQSWHRHLAHGEAEHPDLAQVESPHVQLRGPLTGDQHDPAPRVEPVGHRTDVDVPGRVDEDVDAVGCGVRCCVGRVRGLRDNHLPGVEFTQPRGCRRVSHDGDHLGAGPGGHLDQARPDRPVRADHGEGLPRSQAARSRTPCAVAPGCSVATNETGSAASGSGYSRSRSTATSSAVAPARPP